MHQDLHPGAASTPSSPAHVHHRALTALLVVALLGALYVGRPFFLPIVLALYLNFLLRPLVRGLRRLRVPEAAGAMVVLVGLLGTIGYAFYQLSGPAAEWMARMPQSLSRIEERARALRRPVERVTRAAAEVEKIATGETGRKAPEVKLKQPGLGERFLSGTQSAVAQATATLVLLYFLLASGDLFLLKLVRVLPRLAERKRAVEIVRSMEQRVSLHLLTVALINVGLGAAVGVAMGALGMPNPALWAVMAAVLAFIPYLGAVVGVVVVALVALLALDGSVRALLAPAVYMALVAVEGNIVTPLVLGRRLTLNPVVILVWLSLWWWLWGVPGALLAVPMLATVQILCEHILPLAPVGEFLAQ